MQWREDDCIHFKRFFHIKWNKLCWCRRFHLNSCRTLCFDDFWTQLMQLRSRNSKQTIKVWIMQSKWLKDERKDVQKWMVRRCVENWLVLAKTLRTPSAFYLLPFPIKLFLSISFFCRENSMEHQYGMIALFRLKSSASPTFPAKSDRRPRWINFAILYELVVVFQIEIRPHNIRLIWFRNWLKGAMAWFVVTFNFIRQACAFASSCFEQWLCDQTLFSRNSLRMYVFNLLGRCTWNKCQPSSSKEIGEYRASIILTRR